jgi:two-component system cell cycle sensor histidine kinase/response regulator CckA
VTGLAGVTGERPGGTSADPRRESDDAELLALREQEGMLRIAGRVARLGAWSFAVAEQRLTWSDELCAILDLPAGTSPTADEATDFHLPEYRAAIHLAFGACLRDGTPIDIVSRAVSATGRRLWIRLIGLAERDSENRIARLHGAFQDVSEAKLVERRLSLQFAVSRVLAESSTAEVASPRILEIICTHSGWDVAGLWDVELHDDVLQCGSVWSASPATDEDFLTLNRRTTFGRGEGLAGQVWDSGQSAWISDYANAAFPRSNAAASVGLRSAFAFPIVNAGTVIGVVEFFSRDAREPDADVLETLQGLGGQLGEFVRRIDLERRLAQSRELETVGKLAGGVAHEFNTILTAIIGNSDLLLADLPPDDPLRDHAAEIRKAADRAAGLTRQLLAYGRKQLLELETVDLNRVIASMQEVLHQLAGPRVALRLSPAPRLALVNVDAGQIEHVIAVMTDNAADAMPTGGTLTLETANVRIDAGARRGGDLRPGDYVMLSVTDTGTGMTPEVQARLFEPFFSTKAVGEATGLGLATSYRIIKQSGGDIDVESEPGRGTSFEIFLPSVTANADRGILAGTPRDLARGTETILLVEDDIVLREMASAVLQRQGYIMLSAATEVTALSLLRATPSVDLLVASTAMPQLGVKQLLLSKPFTPNVLVTRVRAALDDR